MVKKAKEEQEDNKKEEREKMEKEGKRRWGTDKISTWRRT